MRFVRALGPAAVTAALFFAAPLQAQPVQDLLEALKVPEILEVMRAEGLDHGAELGRDMLPGGNAATWTEAVSRIYDTDAMYAAVEETFAESFGDTDPAPLIDFFTGAEGQRIVALELAAREALIDEDVEEAAREAWRALPEDDPERHAQIERFIDANDLVEANVAGALNASYNFYLGLVEGGAIAMSEGDMIAEVWQQEDETRDDTGEWLGAFLLMAYEPLTDEALEAYIALSETPGGKALNSALFAGFNRMYDEVSLALGLAAATQMQTQEL